MRKRIIVSADTLKELYYDKHLSTIEIGAMLNCNRQTISNNLTRFNLTKHSPAQARIRYHDRKDFNGSLEEKAYLIGFRLGDLNVYKPSVNSETIIARCHTTTKDQVDLMSALFHSYGTVKVSNGKHGYTINSYLNTTFEFLLPKSDSIEEWIQQSQSLFLAFIGGYIDAEGTFQINQAKGRFALSTCDINMLQEIDKFLQSLGIRSLCKKVANKGTKSVGIYVFSNDVWRINVNEATSLHKFIQIISPYIKHKKRLNDMNIVLENINQRRMKGSII